MKLAIVLLLSVAAGACKEKQASRPGPKGGAVQSATAGGDAAVRPGDASLRPPPPSPRDPAPGVATVEAALASWLAAQNAGDFDVYSGLYDLHFAGIRRSAQQTAHLDRASWLAERKRMFARPMIVSAARVVIVPTPGRAVVTFEQTWASGAYRDVGPKIMLFVATPAGLRIAREELLASRIAPSSRPDDLLATLWIGWGSRVVLASQIGAAVAVSRPTLLDGTLAERDAECDDDPPDYSNENGRYFACRETQPELHGSTFVAEARVRASTLPRGLRALAGTPLVTYDASGATCTGIATEIVAYAERTTSDARITDHGKRPRDLAAAVFTGAPVLTTTVSACSKPLFARPTTAPVPQLWPLVAVTDAAAAPYVKALRALDDYGSWEDPTPFGGATEQFQVATAPDGKTRLVVGRVWGARSCEEYGFVGAVWRERSPAAALELLYVDSARALTVTAVADLETDTRPEVILEDGFLLETRGTYGRAVIADFPDEFPPCLCDVEGFGCAAQ